MKKCPVCQTRFKDTATKCRYCNELLITMSPLEQRTTLKRSKKKKKKVPAWQAKLQKFWKKYWYWSYITCILIAIVAVGFQLISKNVALNKELQQLKKIDTPNIQGPSALEPKPAAAPKSATDWYNNAYALCYKGKCTDPKMAIEYLDKAIKMKPDYAEAYNNRGIAYFDLNNYQQAIDDYSEALRINSNEAFAYHNRGNAYNKLGQYTQAIDDFTSAINLRSELTVAYLGRGMNYKQMGKEDLYCQDIKKACELGYCKELEFAKEKGKCL